MNVGTAGATHAAAAAAQAIRASGAIVRVEPQVFRQIVSRQQSPLVVICESRLLFRRSYKYLTGYKGLAFYAESPEPFELPGSCEILRARTIWMP